MGADVWSDTDTFLLAEKGRLLLADLGTDEGTDLFADIDYLCLHTCEGILRVEQMSVQMWVHS